MVKPQAKTLVVDDEAKNVKLLEALLLPRGYGVVCASNGEEALQQVQQERPDLILLDAMMPGMDGFEVCKILKDYSPYEVTNFFWHEFRFHLHPRHDPNKVFVRKQLLDDAFGKHCRCDGALRAVGCYRRELLPHIGRDINAGGGPSDSQDGLVPSVLHTGSPPLARQRLWVRLGRRRGK